MSTHKCSFLNAPWIRGKKFSKFLVEACPRVLMEVSPQFSNAWESGMTQFYVHNHIINVPNVLTSEHKPALRTFDNLGTFRIFSLYIRSLGYSRLVIANEYIVSKFKHLSPVQVWWLFWNKNEFETGIS